MTQKFHPHIISNTMMFLSLFFPRKPLLVGLLISPSNLPQSCFLYVIEEGVQIFNM